MVFSGAPTARLCHLQQPTISRTVRHSLPIGIARARSLSPVVTLEGQGTVRLEDATDHPGPSLNIVQ
jgi:hypothetical protein